MALDGIEYYGGVGFLKGGLQAAWAITTVSPTYAQEIRTPEFGMGLDGLINCAPPISTASSMASTRDLGPRDRQVISQRPTRSTLKGRKANKRAIEERLTSIAMTVRSICVVSRLTWQKGMDILAPIIDGIVASGARLAILGSGDAGLEGALLAAAAAIAAGSVSSSAMTRPVASDAGRRDAILIPSRFEPCGLTQLYGLRYGCVPIVARTGGLADTVIDANEAAVAAGVATGFQFTPENAGDFHHAIRAPMRSMPTQRSGHHCSGKA
jgi:starch synthase